MEVMKTVKQYSLFIENYEELQNITNQYKNIKNYVYSRYSGINSISLLKTHRQIIRDEWVKTKFAEQWKLPARYWKMALDEAMSNIKTQWSNIKINIKKHLNNFDLTKDELHYVRYILKDDKLYSDILTRKTNKVIDKFLDKDIRVAYIYNLIRRLTRKYKGNIPYSKNTKSFMIDSDMYSYEIEDNKLFLYLMSTIRGKRVKVQLTDKNIHTGNLRILLKGSTIEVHRAIKTQSKQLTKVENIIGIDKGYKYLLVVSNGQFYGDKLNHYLSEETERLKEVNVKRNKLYALEKKYREEGNIVKADNILNHNLGKIKYYKNKLKNDAKVKTYINYQLNLLFKEVKPSELVMENLDFVNWNDRYPKSVKRKLARWIKGYIRKRLEYKCQLNEVVITYINPAYTSKFCNQCGRLGNRNGDIFTCPVCGEIHADYNASRNIINRRNDKQIGIYTPYQKVKQILLSRVS